MYVCRQTSAQQHTLSLVNTHKHTHHLCDCQRSVGVESVERSWTSVTHSVCEASLGRLKALTAASKRTLSLVCQIIVVASPRFPSAGWFFFKPRSWLLGCSGQTFLRLIVVSSSHLSNNVTSCWVSSSNASQSCRKKISFSLTWNTRGLCWDVFSRH